MTTSVTPSIESTQIAEFAQGVRAALADLPAEEVDDLTEGLEADLAEAYAEDLQRELPDPVAYATELRAAAGLPMRTKAAKSGALSGLVQGWKDTRADVAVAIRRNPSLASTVDFLGELRPVWWVARAWLAAWLVAAFFGNERGYGMAGTWWIVLIAFVVVSVQWGRGRWRGKGVPALIAIGNVVAIVALLPVLAAASSWDDGVDYYGEPYPASDASQGITLEGKSVTNIFAYDATGKPLTNVQLFDQEGRPLVAHLDPVRDECLDGAECIADPDGQTFAPSKLETGASVANVFPLSLVGTVFDSDTGEVSIDPAAVPQPATPPYIKVPGLFTPEKVAKSND